MRCLNKLLPLEGGGRVGVNPSRVKWIMDPHLNPPPSRGRKLNRISLLIFAILFSFSAQAAAPSPPTQPPQGPGGSDYAYEKVHAEKYGEGDGEYWIFLPEGAQEKLPVVAFNHGWSAVNPVVYQHWIEHLVRRGNIVIYPRWQKNLRTPPAQVTQNAIDAVKAALKILGPKADAQRFAIVGHSMGALISANMAGDRTLPKPRALMLVAPGKTWATPHGARKKSRIALGDLAAIPADTLMLVVVGDRDRLAKDIDAKRIFRETTGIKPENKNYVIVHSDAHGEPPLVAGHNAPGTAASTDALDYFAYWKLFDALTDAAFYNKHRETALGNTEQQRFMGKWSDGVAVAPLAVVLPGRK